MIFKKKIIFFLLLCYPIACVFSDMMITITGGIHAAHPIAIIPFKSNIQNNLHNNKNLENITSVISSDLRNSGKFNTLPITYLPNQPTTVSEIIPMFWEKIGISTLVLGSIYKNDDDYYTISYQLIDSASNPPLVILENQFFVKENRLRYIAHTISNEIFEKLTGIKGVFCTKIAYVLHHTKKNTKYPYELCISDYDGHNQISIYKSVEPLMSPAWSPNGKHIAYVTFESKRAELVIKELYTGVIRNIISFPKHNGAPAFSPDGKKIAFSLSKTGSLNLYVMDLESGKIDQLTSNRYNNTEPSWFPDNHNLAYTSDQGGTPQIYKIDIQNVSKIERLSWLYNSNHYPNVSTDGTFLVMVNRNQGKQSISKLDLITGQEEILTTESFLADTPSIAPNGTMLLYSATLINKENSFNTEKEVCNSESVLELISIDGKFKARLKGSVFIENVRFPAWSPNFSENYF